MGLDMYLDKHQCCGRNGNKSSRKNMGESVRGETCNAIYWRKVNWIHGWFVNNVQNGVDDCGTYDVSIEQLKELARVVKDALKTKDATLLQPVSGFIFGSSEVDKYYWAEMRRTAKELARVINEDGLCRFTYHASW